MYQHKQARKGYKLSVEFVNGYLTSVAKLKDSLNKHLSHGYFFKEIPKNENVLKAVVVSEIKNTLEKFYEQSASSTYDQELYESQFQNNMALQAQVDWGKSMKSKSKTWLSLYSHDVKTELPDRNLFVSNFTEIIEDFFGNEEFEMYLMAGDILNNLSHHWGGVGFQDFIFETKENVYMLHFDYSD